MCVLLNTMDTHHVLKKKCVPQDYEDDEDEDENDENVDCDSEGHTQCSQFAMPYLTVLHVPSHQLWALVSHRA